MLALGLLSVGAAAASSWRIEPTPSASGARSTFLEGVSCPSRDVCVAVGGLKPRHGLETTLAELWNGTRWTIQPTRSPNKRVSASFSGVSCPTATDCIAVGYFQTRRVVATPLAAGWNGHRWRIMHAPNPARASFAYLRGVSCTSPRFCVAVGYFGVLGHSGKTLVERWNGRRWRIQHVPPSPFGSTLAGVSCSSRVSCVAVGGISPVFGPGRPLALRWNGARWIPQRFRRSALTLLGVSCPARSACTAVGRPARLVKRWNGRTWVTQRPRKPAGAVDSQLNGDFCVRRATCTAVGSYFTTRTAPLAERFSSGRWTIEPVAQPAGAQAAGLEGVACPDPSLCIAVGWSRIRAGVDRALVEREAPSFPTFTG